MSKELEALKRMTEYRFEAHGVERDDGTDFDEDFEIIKNGLERLEAIDNTKPNEALVCLDLLENFEWHNKLFKESFPELFDSIKQALLNSQETKEIYLIYCINNYHNVYMDYRGKPCYYSDATLFKDKFDAHQFLRNNNKNDYYIWKIVNNKDLTDDEKRRID